jgi:uncharacterized membrane protein
VWGLIVFVALTGLTLAVRRLLRHQRKAAEELRQLAFRLDRLERTLPARGAAPAAETPAPAPPAPVPPEKTAPAPPAPPQSAAPAPPSPAPPWRSPPTAPPTPPAAAAPIARLRRLFDIEETLGANWLNKLGIVSLVVGIVLWVGYKLPGMSPPGKVLVGYLASFTLLGGGIVLERKERYRLFARAGIGGGWALVFFTTFAMHHVAQARVLPSQSVDLVLLLGVAAAMVVHTLRYDSQVVTGLAFLLAFTTVTISHSTVYSLLAGAVLALGIVAIVRRKRWFVLEVFGLLASYLNHYVWLRTVLEPPGARAQAFPEFVPSCLLLVLYWAVFRGSYVLRRIDRAAEENVSTAAALLNSALLLAVLRYQAFHPGLTFYALLALGAVELALGQLPRTRLRRTAFVVLSVIGTTLVAAAVPFRFSGANVSILWLAQAQALFLAGILTRERLFRWLGLLAAALTAGHMLFADAVEILVVRRGGSLGGPRPALALAFVVAALLFHGDAHAAPRRWRHVPESIREGQALRALSYVAGLLLLVAAWLALPGAWTAVAWVGLALALGFAGHRLRLSELSYQAHGLAALAFVRILVVNLDATAPLGGMTERMISLSLSAALYYVAARWSGPVGSHHAAPLSAAYTWLGTALVALLAFYELPSAWIAVAWAALSVLLAILGARTRRAELGWQGHVLAIAALDHALAVNLHLTERYGPVGVRPITVALVAGLLYAAAGRVRSAAHGSARRLGDAYTWAGSALVCLLMWYELQPVAVAVGWALFGLVLFELGFARASEPLRLQAYVALAAAFARVFFVNLNAAGAPGELSPRALTTLPLALAFYYVHGRLHGRSDETFAADNRYRIGVVHAWLGTVILAALLRFELALDWVVAGWAALALALLGVAWRTARTVFSDQAAFLGAAILYRTVLHNFFQPPREAAGWADSRTAQVSAACALLLAALAFAFPLRRRQGETPARPGARGWLDRILAHPEQLFFFVPAALWTTLLAIELPGPRVTLAWGLEAVVIFVFALAVGERSFRLAGLGLLLLCVGRILFVDLWRQEKAERYVTLIALGAVFLLVSFLYTRFREKIRRYL